MGKIGRNDICSCGSGRKYKHCCMVKGEDLVSLREVSGVDDTEFRQVFLGEGSVPLTEAIIDELVAGGWPRDDLVVAMQAGASYSPVRKSLIFPPEGGDDWLDFLK